MAEPISAAVILAPLLVAAFALNAAVLVASGGAFGLVGLGEIYINARNGSADARRLWYNAQTDRNSVIYHAAEVVSGVIDSVAGGTLDAGAYIANQLAILQKLEGDLGGRGVAQVISLLNGGQPVVGTNYGNLYADSIYTVVQAYLASGGRVTDDIAGTNITREEAIESYRQSVIDLHSRLPHPGVVRTLDELTRFGYGPLSAVDVQEILAGLNAKPDKTKPRKKSESDIGVRDDIERPWAEVEAPDDDVQQESDCQCTDADGLSPEDIAAIVRIAVELASRGASDDEILEHLSSEGIATATKQRVCVDLSPADVKALLRRTRNRGHGDVL